MLKYCKIGGYNLGRTWVNETRLLALVLLIAIAYSLATFHGETLKAMGVRNYICRVQELQRSVERHSHFWIGLYGQLWVGAMNVWSELAMRLVHLKAHKWLNFQQGLHALSTIQSDV